jgi:hypothetical protein
MRKVRTELFERVPRAWVEWGDVITRYGAMKDKGATCELKGDVEKEAAKPEIGLEKWFAKMELVCDGAGCTHDHAHDNLHGAVDDKDGEGGQEPIEPLLPSVWQETYRVHPKVNPNVVELYRCTWCKNPSAALKKCSGCAKAR